MKSRKLFEASESKSIYVLVGPPSVGKSTWIEQTFGELKPHVINRDELVEKVAEEYEYEVVGPDGLKIKKKWTYDDMFISPPADSVKGDVSEKYGKVVPAPAYMNWHGAPKLVYDKVVEANGKVQKLYNDKFAGAKGQDNIVVDMTNMNANSRKSALKAIEGQEGEYHKVAVVFKFIGSEDLIKKVAMKRAEEAAKLGKSKTIPEEAFNRMFQSYDLQNQGKELSNEEVESKLKQEGFDEVIMKDNIEELKKVISEVKESNSFKYLKKYESFRKSK